MLLINTTIILLLRDCVFQEDFVYRQMEVQSKNSQEWWNIGGFAKKQKFVIMQFQMEFKVWKFLLCSESLSTWVQFYLSSFDIKLRRKESLNIFTSMKEFAYRLGKTEARGACAINIRSLNIVNSVICVILFSHLLASLSLL